MKTKSLIKFLLILMLVIPSLTLADEIILSAGGGKQPDANQQNRMFAIDYSFYKSIRSERSALSWGVSYTRISTNSKFNDEPVEVYTLYPQLTLYPVNDAMQNMYFFARALGPSYITANRLGERKQSRNFTFQAQVGVGYEKKLNARQSVLFQLSWRHFSNADLFSDNDGIDLPFVISVGFKY